MKTGVGTWVRAQRTAREWSQKDLALRAGVAQATISKLELGRIEPGSSTLIALANALGARPDTLLALAGRAEEAERFAAGLSLETEQTLLVDARRAIGRLPIRSPSAKGALLKLAEELSKAADDDCRLRFEEAVRKASGPYAAADRISPEERMTNFVAEVRYHMFGET